MHRATVSISPLARRAPIRPTKRLTYIAGIRAAMESINAKLREPHSWIGRTEDSIVFIAEIDHVDKANNLYSHHDGTYHRVVAALPGTAAAQTTRHTNELFEAVSQAFSGAMRCHLMLVRGAKNSVAKGGVRAAVDGDSWMVEKFSGSVADGFEFDLVRVQ